MQKSFWEFIDSECEAKGIKLWELALMLGVPRDTFYSWKHRGQFREDLLEPLNIAFELREATQKLTPEKLAEMGGVTFVRSSDLTEVDSLSYAIISNQLKNHGQRVLDIFHGVGEQDSLVFASATVTPLEFRTQPPEGLAGLCGDTEKAIIQAISNGAHVLYIRPSEYYVNRFLKHWGIDVGAIDEPTAKREFDGFAKKAKVAMKKKNKNWVGQHLNQCYIDEFPMWMPGFVTGFHWRQHGEQRMVCRVTARLPSEPFDGGVLLLPPDQIVESRMHQCILKVVNDQSKRLQNSDSSQEEDSLRLQFYERLKHKLNYHDAPGL